MNKRDALKLRRGDRLMVNDHWNSQKATYCVEVEVLHVTPKGGILVRFKSGIEKWDPS
jgi:hypothetical protein